MSAPDATIRDSDWKPMSYIAPSPPRTHSRRSGWPAASHRARIPAATAGAFSNSEFVHGTRYGLNGYVLPNTVLQPVDATMPIDVGPWTWRVAATIIRIAVASPQPAQEPAPPTYPKASSPSMTSARALSFR